MTNGGDTETVWGLSAVASPAQSCHRHSSRSRCRSLQARPSTTPSRLQTGLYGDEHQGTHATSCSGITKADFDELRRSIDKIGSGRMRAAQMVPEDLRMPFDKRYVPGPGAYRSKVDRWGRSWQDSTKKAWSFGVKGMTHLDKLARQPASPGPAFNLTSTVRHTNAPRVAFGKDGVLGRYNYHQDKRSNMIHWNPEAARYFAQQDRFGKGLAPGAAAPAYSFPHSVFRKPQYEISQDQRIQGIAVGYADQMRENLNVFGPGPAAYHPEPNPDVSPTKRRSEHWTLREWGRTWTEGAAKCSSSPGPIYGARAQTERGARLWGDHNVTVMGTGARFFDPELNLAAVPYLSEEHAKSSSYGVHSPGPVFLPSEPGRHVSTPNLAGFGASDRFYTRFETGRVT